jgi:hypothetical protein
MHHFIPDPAGGLPVPAIDPSHTAAIRRWTVECLRLPEDAVVSVNEVACIDPGCPLVETVIAVFEDGRTRSWKFTRPRVAVTRMMVEQTLRPA